MRIVQATPEHLDLLTPLFVKYREFYDAMPYPETSRSFLEKRLTRKESVIYLALADDEDKLMGFCQLYPSFSSLSLPRRRSALRSANRRHATDAPATGHPRQWFAPGSSNPFQSPAARRLRPADE